MFLIDSVYINRSGGKILLEYFIQIVLDKGIQGDFYFLLDNRIVLPNSLTDKLLNYEYLPPSEFSRRKFYIANFDFFNGVLCFANVPPPINFKDKVVFIYFHNVLLIQFSHVNLTIIEKFYLLLKRFYITFLNRSNYVWITQTPIIKELLISNLRINKEKIDVIPFFDTSVFSKCNELLEENYSNYLYVADSSIQKNHLLLLSAWELFIEDSRNKYCILHLTLPTNSPQVLLDKVKVINKGNVSIINHYECSVDKVRDLYQMCNYFIFPSLAESFGLPLIEACSAGCKIISSDLPYVYHVIKPSLVFNPYDHESILNSLYISRDYYNVKNSELNVKNNVYELLNTLKYV